MKRLLVNACLIAIGSSSTFAQDAPAIQIDQLAKTGTSWDGSALPRYGPGDPEITILRVTIPPGGEISRHKHPVINAGVLLSGSLTVVTEDADTLNLAAGDALVEVVEEWHSGKNEGEDPAVIVVFYAGNEDRSISISGGDDAENPVDDRLNPLVGTWLLESLEAEGPDHPIDEAPYGESPTGYLTYTDEGRMQVILAPSVRPAPFATSLSYAGRYSISGDVVTHHVEVSIDPNRVGKSIDHTFAIHGDRVVLTTPPTSVGATAIRFTLTWRRH